MAKGNIFSGARAIFSIGGAKVAYASNASGTEEIEYFPIEVLDNIEIEEFVPVAYRVTFTASRFRALQDSVKALGWFPKNGGSPDAHMRAILTESPVPMSCTIVDRLTDAPFMTLEQVKLASHSWTLDARGVVREDLTFVAIRMRDEAEAA